MNTQKSSQITKDPQHRHLIRPRDGGTTFSPSDAEKGNPLGEGGVDLSAARRGIEQTAPFAPQPEPFIGKAAVGKLIGMCPRTVDNWILRGLLPYYKIGRSVRFRASEVAAHLAQNCRVVRRSRA